MDGIHERSGGQEDKEDPEQHPGEPVLLTGSPPPGLHMAVPSPGKSHVRNCLDLKENVERVSRRTTMEQVPTITPRIENIGNVSLTSAPGAGK